MKTRVGTDKRLNVTRAIYLVHGEDNLLHAGEVHGCSVGEGSERRGRRKGSA